MPMWPFGRRGGKAARSRDAHSGPVAEKKPPIAGMSAAKAHEFASRDVLRDPPARCPSTRSSRSSRSNRRRRRASRTSASLLDLKNHSSAPQPLPPPHEDTLTALPNQRRLEHSPHLRSISQQRGTIPYNFQSKEFASQSSLAIARDRGKLQRPQSLRKSANESFGIVRRLSSRKQKREHEHLREEEIRAMSIPLPQKRSAGRSGDMLRRDSKKVKGNLNRRFARPESSVSLPTEESIHSSMSGSSDPRAFRVGAFDMLSPRPTVRCFMGSQYHANSAETSPSSKKQRGRLPVSRDSQQDSKEQRDRRTSRIDELADDLDTGALRDILDRDKRRREKKRKADEERLHRRLERRAEKQRAADATPRTPTTPRGEARGTLGLGIEADVPMEDVRPSTPQHRPTPLTPHMEETSQLLTPLDSPTEEPVISNAQAIRYSRGSVSATHTRGPSNVSQMPELLSERFPRDMPMESVESASNLTASGSLHAVDTTDTAATSSKGAIRRRSSEGRRLAIFASLFRRGQRKSQDQGRTTPSEVSFSNTSRESMSRQPLPAHLVATSFPPTAPVTIKRPTNVPRRTRSKFREDLPDFTPPDSRVQSPEVLHNSIVAARRMSQQSTGLRIESDSSSAARTDSPVSTGAPNLTGLVSQSLASIDSEASWLSGKPIKRSSNKSHLRSSVGSSTALKNSGSFNASYEELGVPDDEYFRRMTPQPDEHRSPMFAHDLKARRASSTVLPPLNLSTDSDDEGATRTTATTPKEDELVHSSIGRQPTVIHRQARVKSTEALLSFYSEEKASPEDRRGENAELVEAESPTSENEAVVERAKSVELGKHHLRHLSAGSAKLLDIQKRGSMSSQSKLTH